jgi:AcrR family transcriptional regulator
MLVVMSQTGAGRRAQAERSQESRERILDAAVDCLVRAGYSRTNTASIQAQAEVSRGRLLHQFPSKDELLVAAAHHVSAQRLAETVATADSLPSASRNPGARLDAVVTVTWQTFDRPYFWAATELWLAARTAPQLASAILPGERRLGAVIRTTLDALYGEDLARHPMYPVVRDVIFTSMRGVAMTYAFDQREPATEPSLKLWRSLARTVLAG